jgi:hypothetical protein
LEGAHKRRKGEGDKETQSTKKLVPHIVELGPENTLAAPPNDSVINPQIWRGGLRISLVCSLETFRCRLSVRTLVEDYGKHVKVHTDRSKMGDKVGNAIVKEEHTIKKRILPQNTVFSAEQSAIIGAIQSEKNSRHKIVIIMDCPSMVMAPESRTPTKNPKTQTIRKTLD